MNKRLYSLMNWPKIEEIIYSECDDPHALLGPHDAGSQALVQAFFPDAKKVAIVLNDTGETFQMELADTYSYLSRVFCRIPANAGKGCAGLSLCGEGGGRNGLQTWRGLPFCTADFKEGHGTIQERDSLYGL